MYYLGRLFVTSLASLCLRVSGNSPSDCFRRITSLSSINAFQWEDKKKDRRKDRNLMVSWRRDRGFLVLVAISASSLFRDSTKSVSIGVFLIPFFVWLEDACCFRTNTLQGVSRTLSHGVVDSDGHVASGGNTTYSCQQLSRRPYLQSKQHFRQNGNTFFSGKHIMFRGVGQWTTIWVDRYF